MALTVTTDLTVLTTAESLTNWVSIGSGGAGAMALEPDYYVQGNNCISRGVSGAATEKGMWYNNGSGIDFTTGTHKDKLVYIWMYVTTPGLTDSFANGGVKVWLGTNTTNYRTWIVGGNDVLVATRGWVCYVIDPQSAGSGDTGTYNAASVQYFGGTIKTTTTAKGQNFGIDQISYGRGEIYVSGTTTTTGEGFKEIAAVAYDSARSNRWGIITERAGIYYVKGKIVLGHPTSNTTFSSRGETVVWETPYYRTTTPSVVKSIPDASVGGTAGTGGSTTYNGLVIRGGTGTTSIDFGVIAGTDSGRSGSAFSCAIESLLTTPGRTTADIVTDDSTMALSLYASSFANFEGAVDLYGTGVDDDDMFACTFNGCGRLRSNMEMRNCNILNSVASTTDGAYIWESTTNLEKCLFVSNSRAIVFESTTGTPFTFTNLTFSGNTFDVRNESTGAITINVVGGTTPTYEDIGGGSATTLVINPVTTTLTVTDIVSGDPVNEARALVYAANATGPLPYQKSTTITRSGSTATATCTAHGLADGKKVLIKGANQQEYNGVHTVTVTGANTFTFTVTGTPTTPATGTIVSTGVVIDGLTNTSGIISDTRSFSANQPITGRVRRATFATDPGPTIGALTFNAAADKLYTASGTVIASPNSVSTCFWAKFPTGADSLTFFDLDCFLSGMAIWLNNYGSGSKIWVYNYSGDYIDTGFIATMEKWYFFGLTRNGTSVALYIGDETNSPTKYTATDPNGSLGINWQLRYGQTDMRNGEVDFGLARAWDGVLSDAEMEAEWDSATVVKTSNLVGDWKIDTAATPGTDDSAASNDLLDGGSGSWTEVSGPSFSYLVPRTLYRTGIVSGTISSTAGFSANVQLIRDE